ncbi:uncharacterized protein LOC120340735 isoform X2 [Styela clava]
MENLIKLVKCVFLVILFVSESKNAEQKELINTSQWVVTKKYQMSGDEFVRLFFEKGKILRITDNHREWDLYNYWWQDHPNLTKIEVGNHNAEFGDVVSHISLANLKSSKNQISFEHEITGNQDVLVESVLIPVTILSCKDLYLRFKDTLKYSLFYADGQMTNFGHFSRSTYVMIISGEWEVFIEDERVMFRHGELLYIPKNFKIQKSYTKGKFLAIVITWDQFKQGENETTINCNPVTLQSAQVKRGWSRITSISAQANSTKLNTGYTIPPIGLGTYKLGPKTYDTIGRALRIGYRMIDASKDYFAAHDQDDSVVREIGKAIEESKLSREDIFLSKSILLGTTSEEIYELIQDSLNNLKSSYMDLLMIELPFRDHEDNIPLPESLWKVWHHLKKFQKSGVIRSLGIRNVKDHNELSSILAVTGKSLSVVQNWFDLFRQDNKVRQECRKNNITYMGYGIMGFRRMILEDTSVNRIIENPVVTQLALGRDIPRGSLLLRWAMERGVVVTPSSSDEYHLESNFYSRQLGIREDSYIELDNIEKTAESEMNEEDETALTVEVENINPKEEL